MGREARAGIDARALQERVWRRKRRRETFSMWAGYRRGVTGRLLGGMRGEDCSRFQVVVL